MQANIYEILHQLNREHIHAYHAYGLNAADTVGKAIIALNDYATLTERLKKKMPDLIRENVGRPIAKGIRTRAGQQVRILANDRGGTYPIVFWKIDKSGNVVITCTAEGFFTNANSPCDLDLIPEEEWSFNTKP